MNLGEKIKQMISKFDLRPFRDILKSNLYEYEKHCVTCFANFTAFTILDEYRGKENAISTSSFPMENICSKTSAVDVGFTNLTLSKMRERLYLRTPLEASI